jgi:hypothetical protein
MSDMIDWSQYRLAHIWEMVKNESTEVGDRQAQAWTNTATLCEDQAEQLDRAAAQLAETWTPAPGTAAEGFQEWLRRFTDSLRGSAAAARTNSVAISDITYQMAAARDKLSQLVGQSHHYQNAEQIGPPQYALPGRVPPPVQPRGSASPPLGWRTALDQQAREIMIHTEAAVVLQASRVQMPPRVVDLGSERIDSPQPIPPPTWPGGSAAGGVNVSLAPAALAPTMPLVVSLDARTGEESLPVLDGAAPWQLLGTGPATEPGRALPVETVIGLVTTPAGPALPPGGMIGVTRPVNESPEPSRRTTAPARAAGASNAGRTATGTVAAPPMIPPHGGVRPGAGRSTSGGHASGARRKRDHDPSDPWAVPEGGPAVLEPPIEPIEHDPGPGVIGLDR